MKKAILKSILDKSQEKDIEMYHKIDISKIDFWLNECDAFTNFILYPMNIAGLVSHVKNYETYSLEELAEQKRKLKLYSITSPTYSCLLRLVDNYMDKSSLMVDYIFYIESLRGLTLEYLEIIEEEKLNNN